MIEAIWCGFLFAGFVVLSHGLIDHIQGVDSSCVIVMRQVLQADIPGLGVDLFTKE
jgi:hypothetical protein